MLSFFKSFTSQIHSQYSVSNTEAFRVGPWSVYDAKSRQTKEPVSVFVLDKKALVDSLASQGYKSTSGPKADVYEFANNGVSRLVKMRHPAIVKLVEPMENARGAMMFVTERVTTSLNRLLKSKAHGSTMDNDDLNELVIVRGLAMVIDGLRFLQDQLGYVHLNVNPSSILIDSNGDWKLFGLEFLQSYREITGDFFFPQLDPRMPAYLSPNPDYMAPELAFHHNLSAKNDVFSLACLLGAIYSGHPPMSCRGNVSNYREEFSRIQRKIQTIPFPQQLLPYIPQLFDTQPTQRMSLSDFADSAYFNNSLIKALQFLDDFSTKAASEKVQFLKKFNTVLDQFPKSVLQRKVLKFALAELTGPRDSATGELLANLVFNIASRGMSRLSFSEQILPVFPKLKDFQPFHEAVGANLETIVECTNEKDFTSEVLPVILAIFKVGEVSQTNLQKTVLDKGSVYLGNVTIAGLEQSLFPSAVDLFAATPAKSVKIAAAGFFIVMIEKGLSKSLIQDKLIPTLQAMKTRDPAVVMSVTKLYEVANSKLAVGAVVERSLPHLLELSMGKDLTVNQFNVVFSSVRREIDRIEAYQIEALKHNREVVSTDNLSHKPMVKTVDASVSDIFDDSAFQPTSLADKPAVSSPMQSPSATSAQTFHPPRGSFALNKPAQPAQPAQPAVQRFGATSASSATLFDSFDPISSPSAPSIQPRVTSPSTTHTPQLQQNRFTPAQSQQWTPMTPSTPVTSQASPAQSQQPPAGSQYASLL